MHPASNPEASAPLAAATRCDGRDLCKSNDRGEWLEMDAHTQGSRSAKRPVIYCYDGSEPSRHALEMGSAIFGGGSSRGRLRMALDLEHHRRVGAMASSPGRRRRSRDRRSSSSRCFGRTRSCTRRHINRCRVAVGRFDLGTDTGICRLVRRGSDCRRLSRVERDQVGSAGKRVARAGQQQPTPGTGGTSRLQSEPTDQ